MKSKVVLIVAGAALLIAGATVPLLAAGGFGRKTPKPLIGDDFGRMRHEALALFPRGLPVKAAASGLVALGFQCAPAHRLLANVNAPSVQCDSAGRGYPTASRTQVTVMARNGALSDIAIGNGVDAIVADARTPDPHALVFDGEPIPAPPGERIATSAALSH